MNVVLPPELQDVPQIRNRLGVQFAVPPLPDEEVLGQCLSDSGDRDDFLGCVVGEAMPEEYRITQQCIEDNVDDGGRAFACSTGDDRLLEAYDKFRQVQDCSEEEGADNFDVADCLGKAFLGENEQYYLSCVTQNKDDLKSAAVCALIKDLNPEQQIAISCAIATGGEPNAFAVCAGGQLLKRELTKCWEHGIATDQGCFGPNNEYRRLLGAVDDQFKRALGERSVAYQAWELWQNNVLAPGPGNEVVKAINNGLSDLKNGPGENNEIVKAAEEMQNFAEGIGTALGF